MKAIALVAVVATLASAQTYRCDWSVVGSGGGEMSGPAHRAGVTAGQTASGTLAGAAYSALIGFWLTDLQVGVREAARQPGAAGACTELRPARPSVFRAHTALRFALADAGAATLCVYDRTGRVVRAWEVGGRPTPDGAVTWDGRDAQGRGLAAGVYFVRLVAGEVRQTGRVTLAR